MSEASSNIVARASSISAGSAQEPRRNRAATPENPAAPDFAAIANLVQGAAELAARAGSGASLINNSQASETNLPGFASRQRGTSSMAFGGRASATTAFGPAMNATAQATQEMRSSSSRHDPAARLAGSTAHGDVSAGLNATGEAAQPSASTKKGAAKTESAAAAPSVPTPGAAPPTNTASAASATTAASAAATSATQTVPQSNNSSAQKSATKSADGVLASIGAARPTSTRSAPLSTATGNGSTNSRDAGTQSQPTATNNSAGARAGQASPRQVEFSLQKAKPGAPAQPSGAQAQGPPIEAQAERGLAAVLRQKGGNVRMRVTPDSLGELRISMKLDGPQVWAQIEATSETARELLEDRRDTLRSALEAHGLKVERLDVSAVKPEPTRDVEKEHARDQARERALHEQRGSHESPQCSMDQRHAAMDGGEPGSRQWGGRPQQEFLGRSPERENAGGAGEWIVEVRGAPPAVWAESQGDKLRLRVDALA